MKKHTKLMTRIASVFMVMLMLFSLCTPVAAAETGPGKIVIDNAQPGYTYKIYRVFNLAYVANTNGNATYTYTVRPQNASDPDKKWYLLADATATPGYTFGAYYAIDQYGRVYLNASVTNIAEAGKALAAELIKFVKANTIGADKTLTADSTAGSAITSNANGTYTLTFDNLPLGYYLIESTLGVVCALNTTATSVTIQDKNIVPEMKKEVQEDSIVPDQTGENVWKEANDADIGDTVNFKVTIDIGDLAVQTRARASLPNPVSATSSVTPNVLYNLPYGIDPSVVAALSMLNMLTTNAPTTNNVYTNNEKLTYPYIFHDEMSAGLTLDQTIGIKVILNGAELPATSVSGAENYVIGYSCTNTACTFHIKFARAFTDTLKKDDKIVITYSATLNDTAKVGTDGNTNKAILTYGDDYKLEDITTTYVWQFNLHKHDSRDENLYIAGAEFVLYYMDGANEKYYSKNSTANNVEWTSTLSDAKIFTSPDTTISAQKYISVTGLDSGSYFLKETKAPDGYNPLGASIAFTISPADYDATATTSTAGNITNLTPSNVAKLKTGSNIDIMVANIAASLLPNTGGIGTTIFYSLGSIMVFVAVVLLVTKKRMGMAK